MNSKTTDLEAEFAVGLQCFLGPLETSFELRMYHRMVCINEQRNVTCSSDYIDSPIITFSAQHGGATGSKVLTRDPKVVAQTIRQTKTDN